MTNLITFVSVSLLALSTAVGCAAETASESNSAPTGEIASNAITTDTRGMGCVDAQDSSTGQTHRVCCGSTDQIPDPSMTGSCGSLVTLACITPSNECVFYANDGQEFPCPAGLTCEQCRKGDQAGTRFACL